MPSDQSLRDELVFLLEGGNAHMSFEEAVVAYPMERINTPFPNGSYSSWHLLEHLRLSQWDILDFIRNPDYEERAWPKDYWPASDQQATPDDWQRTIRDFLADRQALRAIVMDPQTDLGADPAGDRADDCARDNSGGRPQRLSHRRVRHHAPGHGYVGFEPLNGRVKPLNFIVARSRRRQCPTVSILPNCVDLSRAIPVRLPLTLAPFVLSRASPSTVRARV